MTYIVDNLCIFPNNRPFDFFMRFRQGQIFSALRVCFNFPMVYIEQVVFDNLFVNAVLLYATLAVLGAQKKIWRIALSASVGTCFAVALPFITRGIIFYKLAALAATTVFCLRYNSLKKYIFVTLIFAALSFLTGGTVYALFYFVTSGANGTLQYPSGGTRWLILAAITLIVYILRQLVHFAQRANLRLKSVCTADVWINGEAICGVKCFRDSGNQLFDELTLKPVTVISRDLGDRYLKGGERLIAVKTVGGQKMLPIIKLDAIIFRSAVGEVRIENVLAAVADCEYRDYKIILNSALRGSL